MEFSWSALWNITDETPDNCEMFLNFNGMKLFLDCLKVTPLQQQPDPIWPLLCPQVPQLPSPRGSHGRAVGAHSDPPAQDMLWRSSLTQTAWLGLS